MPKRLLPFIPPSLRVIEVVPEPGRVTVLAVPRSAAACCPACQRQSDRTHGHRERRLADLPWQGRCVSLRVRLRRLCCRNPACPRRTFSQSLPDVAARRGRRSRRLQDVQRHLGLALGGAPAARLAHRLSLPASPSSFLRMVRAGPTPVAPLPLQPPAVADATLLPDAVERHRRSTILEPDGDSLVRVGDRDGINRGLEPFFANAA